MNTNWSAFKPLILGYTSAECKTSSSVGSVAFS